jgi:hypothetical protein
MLLTIQFGAFYFAVSHIKPEQAPKSILKLWTYSPHGLYNTVLWESSYIPDDGPVWPKRVVEFKRKDELSGDSTNEL